jgi:hypothetical protein
MRLAIAELVEMAMPSILALFWDAKKPQAAAEATACGGSWRDQAVSRK